MPTQITTVSHTRLMKYEQCPLSAKIAYIDKAKEPERPLPPGKTEHANDRGTRIHDAAERFVKGGVELIPELETFRRELEKARDMFKAGMASTEGEWGYTKDWEAVAWMSSDVYYRIKCDLVIHRSPTDVVVIDYKSGKRYGNEIKHGEQMQLYCIGALMRFPDVENVTTELWYTDLDDMASMKYTRDQGLRYLPNYEARFGRMTSAIEFPAKPSIWACRWCPWKQKELGGTGHCEVGM